MAAGVRLDVAIRMSGWFAIASRPDPDVSDPSQVKKNKTNVSTIVRRRGHACVSVASVAFSQPRS